MSLEVMAAYPGATVQDGGRPGYRRFGVPAGGAFDRDSLAAGNGLLGNEPDAAGVEFTLAGATFRALDEHFLAVVGGECAVSVDGVAQDTRRPFRASAGATVTIGSMIRGARAYLCVAGGFDVPRILGSMSGTVVNKGDVLAVGMATPRSFGTQIPFLQSLRARAIRLLPAPQTTPEVVELLDRHRFSVSSHSNRIGIRLSGPPLPAQPEIASEPMCLGIVQLANDGRLVIIGPDGPTIGGYPKVACVASLDHSRLGQLVPDDEVVFRWIEPIEAPD